MNSNYNETDQLVLVDTLKYTSEIVVALTTKIGIQENEINKLNNKIYNLEKNNKNIMKKIKLLEINNNVFKKSFSNKSHTEEVKQIIGKKNSINQKGTKNSQFGTCWICNTLGKIMKIKESDLNFYLDNGWIRGRKF